MGHEVTSIHRQGRHGESGTRLHTARQRCREQKRWQGKGQTQGRVCMDEDPRSIKDMTPLRHRHCYQPLLQHVHSLAP